MRIAYVITALGKGGAEVQLSRLAAGAAKKHDVVVFSLTSGAAIAEWLHEQGVRVVILAQPSMAVVGPLRRELEKFKPEIVNSFMWHANMVARVASIGEPWKVVCSLRFREIQKLRTPLDRATAFLVDAYTANSRTLVANPARCTVIYNGVPESFWHGQVRNPKSRTALMIAHFRPEKDHKTLVAVAKRRPDWKFTLVGDGPLRWELEQYCKREGITNVIFAGAVSDVRPLLLNTECLVHLSFSEGMPNAVIEAMLLGVPIIASDIPENRELVDGRGVLVPVANAAATARALDTLLPAARIRSAMLWAREVFNEQRMIAAYLQLYYQVLGRS